MTTEALGSSFRDPAGCVLLRDGLLYRRVAPGYRAAYTTLMTSGLYAALTAEGALVAHEEVGEEPDGALLLRPVRIPFISYPYEWCARQWQEAALLTLRVQLLALAHGMTLKDASAFNVQFMCGRPLFIDTLSFEPYTPGAPWVAYRQFCEHFLAPLALMVTRDPRLGQWLRVSLDGIPLQMAAPLLPWRTRWNPSLLLHLHLHARFAARGGGGGAPARPLPAGALQGLLDSLESGVRGLRGRTTGGWSDYYAQAPYPEDAFAAKEAVIARWLQALRPATVWDLGANTGRFSRLAAEAGAEVLAFDVDHAAVEAHYLACLARGETRILPLVLDLTNPSPALGWMLEERMALPARGPATVVLALALVHHLALGQHLPLARIAEGFAALGQHCLVEFVPPEDPRAHALASRAEQHGDYTRAGFEAAFARCFTVRDTADLPGSARRLYWYVRREEIT